MAILLVEDDPPLVRLERAILTRDGFDVEVAPDGPTALERVKMNTYEAIVLDIGLPGMDGYEVARAPESASTRAHAACTSRISRGAGSVSV